MTYSNPYRNVSQDPEFLAQCDRGQQQASPEAIERYKMSFEMHHDQAQISRAIAAYEEARMVPKPKFILHIDGDHFHARPSPRLAQRPKRWRVTGAAWFGLLFSLYLVFA